MDAREKIIRALLEDVLSEHSDPDSHGYNECNLNPCLWCESAKALLDNKDQEEILRNLKPSEEG